METPFDLLVKLQENLATVAQQLAKTVQMVKILEAKNVTQQGQIEIVMSLLAKHTGRDEFVSHLKFVAEHPNFGKESKFAASEMLRQDVLWPQELLEGPKQ